MPCGGHRPEVTGHEGPGGHTDAPARADENAAYLACGGLSAVCIDPLDCSTAAAKTKISQTNKGPQLTSTETLYYTGAWDENRTHTAHVPRDFKSLASTNSATQAGTSANNILYRVCFVMSNMIFLIACCFSSGLLLQ